MVAWCERGLLLLTGAAAAAAAAPPVAPDRALRLSAAALSPGLGPGAPGNATACIKQLAQLCPLQLAPHPSPARRANETAACTSCTSRPVVSLQLLAAGCLPPVEKAYCDLPDVGENKVTESCQVALTAAFQPLLKDPTGARGAEAIASWGQHMGDPGFYYQCDGTPGFQYWKVYFSPKNGGGRGPHATGRRLQPGGGGGGHGGGPPGGGMGGGPKMLGLCFPDECSAHDVGKLADKLVPLIAPVSDLLSPLQATTVSHNVPNPLDGPALAVVVVLVMLVLLFLCATFLSTDCFAECAAAMPLDENVEERFSKLLEAAGSAATEPRLSALSLVQKWRLCREWEGIGSPSPAVLPKSLTAAGVVDAGATASLSTPLLPTVDMGDSLNRAPHSWPSQRCGFFRQGDCATRLGRAVRPFVNCWDGRESLRMLLSKDTREVPEMRCLNGIRALSMLWIILGHTFQSFQGAMGFGMGQSDQLFAALDVRPRLSAQMVTGAQLGVDTFFFLSGFLAAYIGLKKLRGNRAPGWKVWAGYMWERWIRLTPTYLFILAFYINVVPFLAAGPDGNSSEDVYVGPGGPPHHGPHHTPELHAGGLRRLQPGGGGGHGGGDHGGGDHGGGDDDGFEDLCSDFWWTNILYVSNIIPFSGDNGQFGQYANGNLGCMDWSWYLSVDYQLHLLMPGLLLLFQRSPSAAYSTMFVMWLASSGYVYSLVYRWDGGICGYFFQTAKGNEMTLCQSERLFFFFFFEQESMVLLQCLNQIH